jgi:hypothetical protein
MTKVILFIFIIKKYFIILKACSENATGYFESSEFDLQSASAGAVADSWPQRPRRRNLRDNSREP